MKLKFLFLLFSISCSTQLLAQRKQKIIEPIDDPAYKNWTIGAGYFSNGIANPGLILSAEKPFRLLRQTKVNRKGKERIKYKSLAMSGQLGGYHHNYNHVGMLVSTRLLRRVTYPFGLFTESGLGVGYFHQIQDAPTFEVTPTNEVIERGTVGQGAIAPSITIGFGWDRWFKNQSRLTYFLRASYLVQIPYNQSFILRTPLELGVTYRLGS